MDILNSTGVCSFWRRAAIGAVLLAAGLFSALADTHAQIALRVGKSSAETFAFTPVDIGIKLGIFEKHGLKVTTSDFAGGTRLQQGLAAGAVDIGLGSGPEMASIPLGSPVRAVAMFMGPPSMLVLLSRADGSVEKVEDLKGRRIAVTQLNALTAWLARRLSIELGWGPNGFQLVAVGDDRARLAALRTRQVDAILINTATALKYEDEKQGKIVARFGKYVTHFHNHVIYARNDLIEKNPDAIRAFVRGWFETIEWMNRNKEQTVELSKGIQGVDTRIGAMVYDEAMPTFSRDGRFTAEALQVLADSWIDMGTLKTKPDLKTLYTEEFLP